MAKERTKNFSNFDLMPAFGQEKIKIKINQNLNQWTKTIVQRDKGPAMQEEMICHGRKQRS